MPEKTRAVPQRLKKLLGPDRARYATVAFVDLQGQLRGKTVNAAKLLAGYPHGVPFSPFNMMLDFGDHALFPQGYLSPDLDIGDNPCNIDWDRPRTLPFEEDDTNPFFFATFSEGSQGAGWDPRRLYATVEAKAQALGYTPVYGLEYEYRLLKETPESLREKHFASPSLVTDVSTYGGVMHQSIWSEFFTRLRRMCDQLEVPVASMHWEVAAAMGEVALLHRPGIDALDDGVLFKTHAKTLARKHDLTMTFMARPLEDADGQSGHMHLSLIKRGRNAFYARSGESHMSAVQKHFIGGVQSLLPEWLVMFAPNINSFKRFLPDIFAPTAANWGVENRTTAIRVIEGSATSQRLELRVPGADANPYLAAAALLASGLEGIEQGIEPSKPVTGSSYRQKSDRKLRFPQTFDNAIERFAQSDAAVRWFGNDFVQMFAGTRRAQSRQFARMVSDRELERFLELS